MHPIHKGPHFLRGQFPQEHDVLKAQNFNHHGGLIASALYEYQINRKVIIYD